MEWKHKSLTKSKEERGRWWTGDNKGNEAEKGGINWKRQRHDRERKTQKAIARQQERKTEMEQETLAVALFEKALWDLQPTKPGEWG